MNVEVILWAGFAITAAGLFMVSLFYVSISPVSRIFLSRTLEDWEKQKREKILEEFKCIKLAVELTRIFFLVALLIFFFVIFPWTRTYPLTALLVIILSYALFFEAVPRLIVYFSRPAVIRFFLPSYSLIRAFTLPLLLLASSLEKRAEIREDEENREASDEEIETFIDDATDEGIIEEGEDELLRSVVEFGDKLTKEVMTSRIHMVCVRKEATIDELKDLIIKEKYSRYPVFKNRLDNIEGLVMAKDLLEYADEKHRNQSIEALIRPAIFVPEVMPVSELLKEFQKASQKMAIVVDEHGGVSGLATMEDVVEEIVGEIQDEYDMEEALITENAPLDFTISGATEVEELEELFDTELAEDDFITAGGLVASHLGRFPEKGEIVPIKGLDFEVLDVDRKSIKKLRVRRAGRAGEKPSGEA